MQNFMNSHNPSSSNGTKITKNHVNLIKRPLLYLKTVLILPAQHSFSKMPYLQMYENKCTENSYLKLLVYRMDLEKPRGEIGKEFFDKLETFMVSNYGEKLPRECPECAKCKDDSIPKYFVNIGSLKEHLLEHYRVKYYLENVSDLSFILFHVIYLS